MDVSELLEKRICADCIGEKFLSDLVAASKGRKRKCAYCLNAGATITIEELSDRTQKVLEQFYERTSDEPDSYEYYLQSDPEYDYTWTRSGQEVTDVIEEIGEIPRDAAVDVQSVLQDRFSSYDSDQIGQETEYYEDSYYEYVGVKSIAWEEKWRIFEQSIKNESRYFNQFGKEYLETVFEDLDDHLIFTKNPIVLCGPKEKLSAFYRARFFQTEKDLHDALLDVVTNLGPPPSVHAKAGRMNATGISVFYGASDMHTALAEVRPPVGCHAVTAKFNLTRVLRLLSLLELQEVSAPGSKFDESYAELLSRTEFLKQLCNRMSIPVMPGEEESAYLVTQAIADYLSNNSHLEVDGIVFPSIQTQTGFNVVLFHKASRVALRDIPAGTEIKVSLYAEADGDYYPSFMVWEETPKEPVPEPEYSKEDKDKRVASLKIDEKGIKIHKVKGVTYSSEDHELDFHRAEKVDFLEMKKTLGW